MRYHTPLRYPGGKTRLTGYFEKLYEINDLYGGHYVEPYAGGAGVALSLLFNGSCAHIHLNDLNYPLYCFWKSILGNTEAFCRKISYSRVTVAAWERHKNILRHQERHSQLDIGYAMFFLNRTNRSGIIKEGGVIGGKKQCGEWKIDARFNKTSLIEKIYKIAEFKNNISIYNCDAERFLTDKISKLPKKTLIYIDPPYYSKGQRLYDNFYNHEDHKNISTVVTKLKHRWVVSYDDTPNILKLYKGCRRKRYTLNYSASNYYLGSELMFFSSDLVLPTPNKPGLNN